MANLTKTASGDLSSFIAGKIFDRVKVMLDETKERESDPRVKKAAKKLEEKQVLDPESIPVVDEKLRQQVTKLFGSKIESRLFNLEASVDRTNAAINTIAAGIGDTQELIVNQNQILEDKFDKLLDVLGTNKDVEKKNLEKLKAENEAREIFDQDRMFGSQALLEAVASSTFLGGTLLGFLVRRSIARAGKALLRKTSRKFIPRRLRARGRFLKSLVDGSRRQISRTLGRKSADRVFRSLIRKQIGESVAKGVTRRSARQMVPKVAGKTAFRVAGKKIPVAGAVLGLGFGIERLIKGDAQGAALEVASGLAAILPYVGTGTSFAIDAYLIRRDIEKEFMKEGFASGTGKTKKGPATLHGKELILGRKDMNDISLGFRNAMMGIGTVLTSVSLDVASAAGAESQVRSLMVSDGLNNFNSSPFQYNADIGKVRTKNLDVKAVDTIASNDLPFLSVDKKKTGRTKPPEKNRPEGFLRNIAGLVDFLSFGLTDFDKRGDLFPSGANDNLIDRTGEPGVDFTPEGDQNRCLFDGTVTEIGHDYNTKTNRGYGNYVVIKSIDPVNGQEFEALYAHFPNNAIKVSQGQDVKVGQKLGRMGTLNDPREDIGSITGTHMSVDFFKCGSTEAYPFWEDNLLPLIDTTFSQAGEKLKKEDGRKKNVTPKNSILSGVSPQARAWLSTINKVEANNPDKYNTLVGGEIVPELTEMTIQEVYDMAYGREIGKGNLPKRFGGREVTYGADSHAAGAYQFHPDTMLERAREAGMDPTKTLYSAETQQLLALQHMRNLGIDPNKEMTRDSLLKSGSIAGWEGLSVEKGKITVPKALELYQKMLELELNKEEKMSNKQSFSPSLRNNLLVQKMGDDSKSMENLFDQIHSAGTPIYVLNTTVVSAQSNKTLITRSVLDTNWKEQYRIASLTV